MNLTAKNVTSLSQIFTLCQAFVQVKIPCNTTLWARWLSFKFTVFSLLISQPEFCFPFSGILDFWVGTHVINLVPKCFEGLSGAI